MIDLDELEKLLAEATPGPWGIREEGRGRKEVLVIVSGAYEDEEPGICGPHSSSWPLEASDADAIVALRNAAPTLLALARAGRRLAMVADAVQSQTVNGRRIADAECMCVADARCPFHEMEASLEAWREAHGG